MIDDRTGSQSKYSPSPSVAHMLGRKRRQEDHYTSPINNLHLNYNLRFHLTRNPSPDQPRDEPQNNSDSL